MNVLMMQNKKLGISTLSACIFLSMSLLFSSSTVDAYVSTQDPADQEDTADSDMQTYRDRIIDANSLTPLPPDEDDENVSQGLPRSFHSELIVNESTQNGQTFREAGIALGGFWDTENWGSFSAEALAFSGNRNGTGEQWRGSASLWQRGLQMPGGWSVNNGLGVLNTSLPPLLRDQYRFFLPSTPMLGASSEWLQHENSLQLQASLGRGGVYSGARLSGFEFGDGSLASLGAQWAWSPKWTGAASFLLTDGRIVPSSQGLPQFQNGATRALVVANRWQGAQDSFTFNLQASKNNNANALGGWLDARSERGRYAHRYGAFYLQPDLAWGAFPINNDVRGGYYRLDYQRARWSWNTALDRVDSISGDGFDGWYSNAFIRYQANPKLGYGGGVSMRETDSSSAKTLQLYVDTRTRLGQTRLQYDQANGDANNDSWQVLLDHSLLLREGARLSLSLGFGELGYDNEAPTRSTTFAAYGGFDLSENISIDGTVRVTHGDGFDASRTVDANLAMRWRLSLHWSLLGNLTETAGTRRSPFVLDPLGNPSLFQSSARDRSLYLSLRYEFNAGRSTVLLGNNTNNISASGGSGSIAGSLFLDENKDNKRGANELPAANITVVLDDRYIARTDEQGRFRFDRVSVGEHTVTIVSDNLPLPWFIEEETIEQKVTVQVRKQTTLDIGAVQQR
jgi:hypothetical protein